MTYGAIQMHPDPAGPCWKTPAGYGRIKKAASSSWLLAAKFYIFSPPSWWGAHQFFYPHFIFKKQIKIPAQLNYAGKRCRRWDSNPHAFDGGGFWVRCVCQFRHFGFLSTWLLYKMSLCLSIFFLYFFRGVLQQSENNQRVFALSLLIDRQVLNQALVDACSYFMNVFWVGQQGLFFSIA